MTSRSVLIAGLGLLVFAPYVAFAAPPGLGGPLVDGSVVRARGCGARFFLAFRDEYILVQWLGGDYVQEGDVLLATDESVSLEREGRATFTNLATGRTIDIFIEKALMNRLDYSRTAKQVCK